MSIIRRHFTREKYYMTSIISKVQTLNSVESYLAIFAALPSFPTTHCNCIACSWGTYCFSLNVLVLISLFSSFQVQPNIISWKKSLSGAVLTKLMAASSVVNLHPVCSIKLCTVPSEQSHSFLQPKHLTQSQAHGNIQKMFTESLATLSFWFVIRTFKSRRC